MFSNGSYASIWSVNKGKGNYYDVRISTSRKRKDTGNYETDFSGFVRFCGEAGNQIASLEGKDSGNRPITRVRLGNVGVTNTYDREKKITYWNAVVFSIEEMENNSKSKNDEFMSLPDGDDEELPFS